MAKRNEITHEHAQLLKGIRIWLEDHPDTTPLELGVFNEIVQRVENHAKHGAYVRVRIKNRGDQPSHRRTGTLAIWSADECERLRVMYEEENQCVEDISSALGRPLSGVIGQVYRLRLRRRRPVLKKFTDPQRYRGNSALDAARRIRERRKLAALQERESA